MKFQFEDILNETHLFLPQCCERAARDCSFDFVQRDLRARE